MVISLIALVLSPKTAWSPVVNGLEGRVSVCPIDSKYAQVTFVPYLVLHNRNLRSTPIRFNENFGNLKLKFVDDEGRQIGPGPSGDHDGVLRPPFKTDLPSDATIRLNVATSGFGVPAGALALVETGEFGLFLPKGFVGRAFLTGIYSVDRSPDGWTGVLNLPKILVWDGRSPVVTPKS